MPRAPLVLLLSLLSATNALAAITGSVFSDRGKPVAKATVTAYRAEDHAEVWERLASGGERTIIASTATKDDGTFTLEATGVVELLVSHDGYGPQRELALDGEAPPVFTLPAAPARTLKVTAGGKPVAKARVYGVSDWTLAGFDLGVTDGAGELAVPDPGRWSEGILVVHPDYAPKMESGALAIQLSRGTTVSGRILDAHGKPVPDALLVDEWLPLGRSKEDGTFSVQSESATVDAITRTAAGRGANEIRLVAAPSIRGTVVDDQGRPVAGLPVLATPKTDSPDLEEIVVRVGVTDEKGRFRIDALRAVEQQVFTASVGDLASDEVTTADLRRGEPRPLALKLKRAEHLRGMVLDERKKPVGGAVVYFLPEQMPITYLSFSMEAATTRSAGDGSFRITMPGQAVRLAVIHPDYAATATEVIEPGKGRREPVTVILRDGIEVKGSVVDEDGKPVAGAQIAVVQEATSSVPMPIEAALMSGNAAALWESAADGTFRLRLNEAPHDVSAWKEGYAPARIGGFRPGAEPLRLVASRGVTIEGRVVKKGGVPLAEGEIYVSGETAVLTRAPINPDGTFVLQSLAPGEYSLHVMSGKMDSLAQRVVVAPAKDVVIELGQTATVTGTVTDKAGMPITAYHVSTDQMGMDFVEDGRPFSLEVPAGPTTIHVEARGYVDATREVVVREDTPMTVDFTLQRARSIRGRVVGANGAPLPEVKVSGQQDIYYETTQSGDDGEFLLEGAPPETVELTFERAGYVSREIDVPADLDKALEVILGKGRAVAGRVVNESGQPVEGATVSAASVAHGVASQEAVTAADGTFRIEGLGEGRHALAARKSGYREAALRDVELDASAPIVLTLRGSGATGVLRGRVSGFDRGTWLYGRVLVHALEEDGGFVQGTIQRDGTFRIPDAPAGEVQVRATASSNRREMSSGRVTAVVPAGGQVEVNLDFDDGVVIRGVVTAGGQPAPGRYVSFYGGRASWRGFTDENGRYEVSGLEPGTYAVSVVQGESSFDTEYEVTGSANFDIAVDFARLEGRVVDGDGAAVTGATIDAWSAETGGNTTNATSDSTGAFVLEIPAGSGRYDVRASKKGFAMAVQTTQRNAPPLLLRLVKSDGLRVRVVDARDNTTLSGYVVARDARGAHLGRVHDQENDGTMHVAVAPGAYRISVSADGYATQTVPATVPRQEELRIAVTPGGTLIVRTGREATEMVKLVMPNGDEYVRCECSGLTEIRLTGKMTRIEHVAPGTYAMQVIGTGGRVLTTVPVQISEGTTTVAEVKW